MVPQDGEGRGQRFKWKSFEQNDFTSTGRLQRPLVARSEIADLRASPDGLTPPCVDLTVWGYAMTRCTYSDSPPSSVLFQILQH